MLHAPCSCSPCLVSCAMEIACACRLAAFHLSLRESCGERVCSCVSLISPWLACWLHGSLPLHLGRVRPGTTIDRTLHPTCSLAHSILGVCSCPITVTSCLSYLLLAPALVPVLLLLATRPGQAAPDQTGSQPDRTRSATTLGSRVCVSSLALATIPGLLYLFFPPSPACGSRKEV